MTTTLSKQGTLFVVSTPIGNLDDMTFRAVQTLKDVSVVFAEDTRSFQTIKVRYGIDSQAKSLFEHNERVRINEAIDLLKQGLNIALVSEAGTPTISDPGYRLVNACKLEKIPVSPIPGCCAAVAALSASGLETDQFYFMGFVPQKPGKRLKALKEAISRDCTAIFYESPHRLIKTLEAINSLAPERLICVAREITKIHEEIPLDTASNILSLFKQRTSVKGECVVIIGKERKGTIEENDDCGED